MNLKPPNESITNQSDYLPLFPINLDDIRFPFRAISYPNQPKKGRKKTKKESILFRSTFSFLFSFFFFFEKSISSDFESLVHVFTSIIGRRLRVVPEVPRWNNATGNNLVGPPFSLFHATGGTDETMVERWERGEKEREREEGQTMTHTRRDPCNMPMHSMNCRNRSGAILSENVNHEHPSKDLPRNLQNLTRIVEFIFVRACRALISIFRVLFLGILREIYFSVNGINVVQRRFR